MSAYSRDRDFGDDWRGIDAGPANSASGGPGVPPLSLFLARTAFVLFCVGIAGRVLLGDVILNNYYHYSTIGGNLAGKIHPSNYVFLVAAILLYLGPGFRFRGPDLPVLRAVLIFGAVAVAVNFPSMLRGQTGSVGYIADTYLFAMLAAVMALAWRCTIAGNGDLQPWQKAVADAGLQNKVDFTGWLDISRIHNLMLDAELVVLPSRAEALPLSLIEGTSAGAALISCDVGAVREVCVDGRNGIIVPHDGAAVGAAMTRLLLDKELRENMQVQSRALFLEAFHMKTFVSSILNIHDLARGTRDTIAAAPVAAE